jgi:hypothetical protein
MAYYMQVGRRVSSFYIPICIFRRFKNVDIKNVRNQHEGDFEGVSEEGG